MSETSLWTAWFGGVLTPLVTGLIVLNILVAWFAFTQKKYRSKLERDILAAEAFGSVHRFAPQRTFKELSQSEENARGTALEDASLLKIDQAIKMLKNGVSLEEIKSALDIEGSYLQIIATHHRR